MDRRSSTVVAKFERDRLQEARTWVVKVGSALLSSSKEALTHVIPNLCSQIAQLMARGHTVLLVSSGAVAMGMERMGIVNRPTSIHELQAVAASGQVGLMLAYEQELKNYDIATAMVLLTHDDLSHRRRYLNAQATLETLMAERVLPVINENDSVATDEIRFGDNDTLAARIASLVLADVLVILTDQRGLHETDPRLDPDSPIVDIESAHASRLDEMVGSTIGELGRGGMLTKLEAARFASKSGCHTVIADGRNTDEIISIAHGNTRGTLLVSDVEPMVARKRWIAGQLRAKGELVVDAGAESALKEKGVSLLAVGVLAIEGEFQRGDLVTIKSKVGGIFAQGFINYASDEARRIMGKPSDRIIEVLGYVDEPELIHRENLALLTDRVTV